jgi:hypothetical protein
MPYDGAPTWSYLTTGSKDARTIYLLDPYISATVAGQLFNSPTDQTAPGLGIFPPQLFQQIRGWSGLRQIKPVDWPDGLQGCDGPALRPLPLRGQASRVGTTSGAAQVTLDTTIAGTGPIDLSRASLFLRQVLLEADGVGELVQGAGGSSYLPLELVAARGSRPNRATFRTPAGARPILTVDVTNRDPETGRLAVSLSVHGSRRRSGLASHARWPGYPW